MSLISLGDMAQSFMLRRQTVAVKSDLQRLTLELTTGRVADIAARVSGDLVPISGIDASLARLNGYRAVTAETGLFAGSMQIALGVVDDLSSDLSRTLLAATSSASQTLIDAAGSEARSRLETAMSALNTRVGDRTLFAGVATTGRAIVDMETMMLALDTAAAGATTAQDIELAVSAWFNAPTGFAAVAYTGGAALARVNIAPGEEAAMDITANDPAIRSTVKGLALAVLLGRGVLVGQPAERQNLANRAGLSLLESQTDRTYLAARLGAAQAQIDAAASRNAAETTSLQIARADMTAADPFETASKLQETQQQLEKIYAITARITRLSLMDYLR